MFNYVHGTIWAANVIGISVSIKYHRCEKQQQSFLWNEKLDTFVHLIIYKISSWYKHPFWQVMIWGVKQHFLGQDLFFVASRWCCLDFNYDGRELLGTAQHRFYILWMKQQIIKHLEIGQIVKFSHLISGLAREPDSGAFISVSEEHHIRIVAFWWFLLEEPFLQKDSPDGKNSRPSLLLKNRVDW